MSCTGADFAFTLFAPGSNSVNYDVSVRRDVTLFVNGRRIRTVGIATGTTRVRVSVPIVRGRAQTVTARVRFGNGAAPRTLVHRAVRRAAAAVTPQFTG